MSNHLTIHVAEIPSLFVVPRWANWYAQDADGNANLFYDIPTALEESWWPHGALYEPWDSMNIPGDWRNTLRRIVRTEPQP